jgi:hypothetical protein
MAAASYDLWTYTFTLALAEPGTVGGFDFDIPESTGFPDRWEVTSAILCTGMGPTPTWIQAALETVAFRLLTFSSRMGSR